MSSSLISKAVNAIIPTAIAQGVDALTESVSELYSGTEREQFIAHTKVRLEFYRMYRDIFPNETFTDDFIEKEYQTWLKTQKTTS